MREERGGPSRLRKGEEQELKVSLLLSFFWLCATSKETMSYKLVVRCCYHLFLFFFALCNVVLQRGQWWCLTHHCLCAICRWRGGGQQHLVCHFFFLFWCSLQAKRRKRTFLACHRHFFCYNIPGKGWWRCLAYHCFFFLTSMQLQAKNRMMMTTFPTHYHFFWLQHNFVKRRKTHTLCTVFFCYNATL